MTALRRVILVLLTLVVFAGTACASDNKVGEGLDTEGLKGKGGQRLGEATTTLATAAPVTTRPVTTVKAAAAATTAPRQATATTAKPEAGPSLVIKIQTQSPQFDPAVAAVRAGSTVRWQNADSQPRSVEADNGAFASPPIPPGGTFDLKAPAPGSYNYHDGTRPYAVAQLQVS